MLDDRFGDSELLVRGIVYFDVEAEGKPLSKELKWIFERDLRRLGLVGNLDGEIGYVRAKRVTRPASECQLGSQTILRL